MNEEYLELLFSAYGNEVGDDYDAFKTAMSNEDYSRMLFETHSEELGDDYAEFNKAVGINIEPYVEPEEEVSISGEYGVKEQDVFGSNEPIKPVISKDISYDDFNMKGQNSAFDNAEENLEEKLASQYPNLTFDTPIMNGGVSNDMLDVTNEDGEVFRWQMNTDYNAGKRDSDGDYTLTDPENREQKSRDNYLNFLEFANDSKYSKDGKYKNSDDVRTLGPDYVVKNDKNQDVEMEVTPGLTKKAISIMRSNPDVTSMDEAIDIALNTEFGQMNVAWEQSIQNKKAKENFNFQSEVGDLVKQGFNPNISGDAVGINTSDDLNETIETLESLGMPKEVVASAREKAEANKEFLGYLSEGGSSSMSNFVAGEPGFTRSSNVAAKDISSYNDIIKSNVRAWLDGSQTWGENTKGPQVLKAYNEAINTKTKEDSDNKIKQSVLENGVDQEQVIKRQEQLLNAEGNTLSKEQALVQAEKDVVALTVQDIKTKKAKLDGDRVLQAELPYYEGKSKEKIQELQSELASIKKLEEGEEKNRKYKEYLDKVRNFLDDDEVNLLKQGDKFVRKDREYQVDALNSSVKSGVKDLLLEAPDKLDEKLLDTDTELLNIAKEIKRKGLSETLNEGSVLQLAGALGQELVGAEGSAFEDFRKIEKWIETGEMPDLLTPLPTSTTDGYLMDTYGEASGQDPLIQKYNDLLQYRSTLLLAQSLNADPTSYKNTVGDGFLAGVARFGEGVLEAIPEAVGMNSNLTKDKQRELGYDVLEDVYGIKKTDRDKANLSSIEHDLWKSSGGMIPGLVRMGGEIYLTTLATGGVGLGPAVLRAATFRTLLARGVSSSVAKNIATYGSTVMTEYIGLQGSNAMERAFDFGPGIENPELFALTAGAIRLKGAQASSKFNSAILSTYKNGSTAQRNALEYFYAFPTTASTEAGALKYTGSIVDRSVKSLSRTTMAAGGKLTGAAGGALTISTADNVGAVLSGDKTVAQALNDVTNPDHLMELGGALLFLGMSRPDKYSKQTIERFRTEVDLIRGNNPQWNKLRRSLGMKTVSDKSEEYSDGEQAFSERVDSALELKKEEINNSNKSDAQKKQEISGLEFNANRLKLKIPLDVLARDLSNPGVMGSYKELEQAAYAISIGGFNAKNLAVIEAASFTSAGTSGIKMLEFYGLDAAQSQQIVDFSYTMRDVAKRHFQGDLTNPNFQKYIDQSIAESRLEATKEKIKKDYDAKRIDKADYETQLEDIDAQLDVNLKSKKELLEAAKVERAGKELEKIEEYKKAGFEIKEMNDAEMKKFMEENGGNFSSTGFGYQGVVNGKSIALINTDATARENVGGTEVHEIWHHPFERRLGSEAMASRIESLMKDEKLTKKQATNKVNKEARDYINGLQKALKNKGIFDIVKEEMSKRPGYQDAMFDEILQGKEIPMSEMKEFINEFIQLNENGAFNNLKSEGQRKSSDKQSTKELTEKEYQESLNDPIKFVDFVLTGKYNSKNINEFLKREADALGEESKTTDLQSSDKTSDVNELALAYESEGGNELWKTFGADEAIKQMKVKDSEGLGMLDRLIASKSKDFEGAPEGFVDKVYAELLTHIRNYKPERQNESGLFGWVNPQIRNKAAVVYNREYKKSEIDQKSKRLSDKVDKEGNREFDVADKGARETVESAGEGKSTVAVETDRQISQFEGKEAKAKKQEILDIYKKELEPGTDINKTIMARKGISGIPRRKNAAVAGLLFNADGNRIVDPTKNPTFSKKLINSKGETIPKNSKEKGIGFSDSEFGNIQKYFSDNANLNRFLKTMMKYSFVPNQARINSKGETIEISKDVKGRGLGLPNRFVDYFFETFKDPTGELLSPSGRTKGAKVQLQTGQAKRLKSEFINPTPEVLNKIKKDLLIGEDLANYDRTIHGQFAKGMAGVEALKTSNEALRKSLSTENKQLEADLRAGLGNLQASAKIKKSIEDSLKDPNLKLPDLVKRNKLNKEEAKFIGKALKIGIDNRKDLLQIIGEAKRDLLKNKEIVEEADMSPGEMANVERQYTAWKKAYPDIAKEFGYKDIEYIESPDRELFKGDEKFIKRNVDNLKTAADIFPSVEKMNNGGAKYLAQAIEAFLGMGKKMGGERVTRALMDDILQGRGKGEVEGWMRRVFQPNWNSSGLKKEWKQTLKEANERFDPKSQEFKDFLINNGRDILTHPDLRGTENGFELTQEANREAIKYLLKGLKNRYRKNPTKKGLEDLARLLQLQTNHQKGILGGLVPMEYVTMVESAGSKDPAKTLHNEHMKEKFNVSSDFLGILSKYKNDLSNPKVNLAIDKLVSEMSQALTTYEGKEFKDSKEMGGAAKSNSANKMINTYLLKGSAETSLYLSGNGRGKTIAEQFIEDYGLPILKKQLAKYEFKDLNSDGVRLKQEADNAKTRAKVKNNNIEVAKEASMNASEKLTDTQIRDELSKRDKALSLARKVNKNPKKIRVFDFDDTIGTSNNKVFAEKDGKKITLNAEDFAKKGLDLISKGWEMDFSDFNKVTEGGKGPLFDLMKTMKEAKGERDIFILTARAPEAAPAIHRFLKEMGIDIPIKNITGLGNSTGEAKADWIVDKAAKGYNDFYFADDAPQNVKAVRKAMSQLDVKSKVQLAKENKMNFSEKKTKKLDWKTDEAGNIKTNFEIAGKKYNFNLDARDSKGSFDVEFNLGGRIDMTGTGDAVKVIRTVYNGLLDIVGKTPKIKRLEFSSLKSEQSRVKLYTTLMDKVAKKLGWETDVWETKDFIAPEKSGYDFEITKPSKKQVAPVEKVLDVVDVKSKVQQTRMNASEKLSEDFNKILEEKTGIGAEKVFSDIKAEIRGNKARKQRLFIPPSAEDFLGLLYSTLPKGKKGEAALDFYQKNLFDPYTRATDNLSRDRVNLMADFKALKKELDVPADLRKETKSGFTNEQAVRVYMWGKEGKDVPGLSKTDFKELTDMIEGDAKLKSFADQIFEITKGDGYNTPGKDWGVGTITTDLVEVLNKTKRAKYLEPWKENVDIIFSKDNLNKLEAAYGKKYRDAMENVLTRMKSGSNRIAGGNRLSNQVLDYINNSTGVTMFLNTRSALLQTISSANFINWSFNNPLMAGKAFANQPQYWKDFTKLMNSDYLVDRRNGLKLNINESEIADAAKTSKNKAKSALNYILEKGYLPTKYADSFAIASGGAMFYRNRVNDLIKKEGYAKPEAEIRAMKEFRQISEKSQQSSDPSKISSQQSGDLGRIILQYANTPMQYARMQKRAIQDIANGRGDTKANVSKIIYYGFLQNLMFNALQQGAFALGFGDDFSDKDKEEKLVNTVNGMLDSSLRGLGLGGVSIQVLKNLGLDIYKRSERDRPEYSDAYYKLLEFSPSIKSKLSRFKSAAYPFDSKKRRAEVFDKGFSLDNPAYESMAKVVTAVTNVPLDRMYLKIDNLKNATADETETWMGVANVLGWPTWQLEPKEYNKDSGVSVKSTVPKVKTKKEKVDKLKSMTYIQLRNKAKKEGKEYSGKNKKELINVLKKGM